jgi:steroid delta-isomerase-like uncharacterized protein
MSAEENKMAKRRLFQELNRRNLTAVDELFAVNHSYHGPAGTETSGCAEFKELIGLMVRAFPDLQIDVEHVIGEGDWVAARATYSGTHTGDLLGIPATGKHFAVTAQILAHFDESKEVEAWGELDVLSMLQQLGVVPGSTLFERR